MSKFILSEEDIEKSPEESTEDVVELSSTAPVNNLDDIKNAFSALVSSIMNKEWDMLNELKAFQATGQAEHLDASDVDFEAISKIIDQLIEEKTVHIGMLTKVSALLDAESQELMDAGIKKAEDIIAE